MAINVSIWLRAFRPPLERAYPREDATDLELAELLRCADERRSESAPLPPPKQPPGQTGDTARPQAHQDWPVRP